MNSLKVLVSMSCVCRDIEILLALSCRTPTNYTADPYFPLLSANFAHMMVLTRLIDIKNFRRFECIVIVICNFRKIYRLFIQYIKECLQDDSYTSQRELVQSI